MMYLYAKNIKILWYVINLIYLTVKYNKEILGRR